MEPSNQVNLKTSGLKDPLTAHGGCPVLVGSKWITNKWVIVILKLTCISSLSLYIVDR